MVDMLIRFIISLRYLENKIKPSVSFFNIQICHGVIENIMSAVVETARRDIQIIDFTYVTYSNSMSS